jgi:hypothetical protein
MVRTLRATVAFIAATAMTFGALSRADAQRVAAAKTRAEIPKIDPKQTYPDPDYSITLPLGGPYRWWIVPAFPYSTQTRITATTPEDGKSQIWTGNKGQLADPWTLVGYASVNIKIERLRAGKWQACALTVRMKPMPNPDPTRRISGNCSIGENAKTEVSIIPSKP